jgi:hypothetical protein
VRQDQERELESLTLSYHARMEEWRQMHARRREARQRHKRYQRDMERGRGSVDADTFAADEELLGQPEPEKPIAPPEFDPLKARSASQCSKCFFDIIFRPS